MLFKNDSEKIIVMYEFEVNKLPKRHLICTLCVKNTYYGFYNYSQDLDISSGYVFTGSRLEIPPEFIEQFNLIRQFTVNCKSQVKLTKYFFSNNSSKEIVRAHFNNFTDSKFKGKCLFHNDKTPSMLVDIEQCRFYCFGCVSSGSFAKLVSAITKIK